MVPYRIITVITIIRILISRRKDSNIDSHPGNMDTEGLVERLSYINPFAPGDFAKKRILKLVEWFSGHCRARKS